MGFRKALLLRLQVLWQALCLERAAIAAALTISLVLLILSNAPAVPVILGCSAALIFFLARSARKPAANAVSLETAKHSQISNPVRAQRR